MGAVDYFRGYLNSILPNRGNNYELDERWEELMQELRKDVEDNGFDLEDNEQLYLSVVAHIVKDNKEGFEMLADEEAAEKARNGVETTKGSSVEIKTISPSSD